MEHIECGKDINGKQNTHFHPNQRLGSQFPMYSFVVVIISVWFGIWTFGRRNPHVHSICIFDIEDLVWCDLFLLRENSNMRKKCQIKISQEYRNTFAVANKKKYERWWHRAHVRMTGHSTEFLENWSRNSHEHKVVSTRINWRAKKKQSKYCSKIHGQFVRGELFTPIECDKGWHLNMGEKVNRTFHPSSWTVDICLLLLFFLRTGA